MAVNEFGIDVSVESSTDSTKEIDVNVDIAGTENDTVVTMTITKPAAALGTSSAVTTVLTVDKTQSGIDPDIFFADQLDNFEYFERDYIENNPGTVNGTFISYVGGFFDDTTGVSTITTGISTENY